MIATETPLTQWLLVAPPVLPMNSTASQKSCTLHRNAGCAQRFCKRNETTTRDDDETWTGVTPRDDENRDETTTSGCAPSSEAQVHIIWERVVRYHPVAAVHSSVDVEYDVRSACRGHGKGQGDIGEDRGT